MEAEKRRYYNQTSYVAGSTVRKLDVEPDYDYDRNARPQPRITNPQRREQTHVNPRPAKHPHVGRGIDFISMLILLTAMAATLFVCFDYLQAEHKARQLGKQIVSLESDLKTLTDKNDNMEIAINQPVDLDEIYRIAVGELGMVHPNNNTIIEYESNEVGYTRQYEDIPAVDQDIVMDKLQP